MRFGDRLKIQRKLKGFTQQSVAQSLSLSKVAISRWERGHSIPSGDILDSLSRLLDVDAEWLLLGEEQYASNSVILVEFYHDVYASAGNGHSNEDESMDKYPMPKNIVNYEGMDNICCIRISGKSMMPVLADGSIVALNTNKKAIKDGMMYVIRQGDLLRVKMLIETPEKIIIRSYNNDFRDEEFVKYADNGEDFFIVGQVVWHSSYLEKN
ncbi:XRE family transcriptional regulator [Vibrio scophthalmi]|uniref:Putative phage repressor n=1 Tax=Vibrio scophthalmi LMG 19158 TaxID=870967 RepID=F9RNB0_9VIBR|nr:S24 family peptidase [Vibrio scophthalmi]EGU37255.1 putative phage repressor [Vibrio scophthalmi LMG 19158]